MNKRSIIFVPGKNPKPPAEQHQELLWRTLLEGARRAVPDIFNDLSAHKKNFSLIAWNYLYYHETKDISRDLPWIDALMNTHSATVEDVHQAKSWKIKRDKFFIKIADTFSFIIPLLSKPISRSAHETNRYFKNKNDVACRLRELLKQELRTRLANNEKVLLIGHSLGSVIAYDTLWELSHEEKLPGKIDMFLTIGSPLGMNYVQKRLMGHDKKAKDKYPANIQHWVNIASVGDIVAVEREFSKSYKEMIELKMVGSIEDHCSGIYNFYRNEEGLNVHRSYGYLVNPAVGKVIADWWKQA